MVKQDQTAQAQNTLTLDGVSGVSFDGAIDNALHSDTAQQLLDPEKKYSFAVGGWEVDVEHHSPWHIPTYHVTLTEIPSSG